MKNIALIGASGYVGSALLQEALRREFFVKAIVRHPQRITETDIHLEIIKGDVTDAAMVCYLVEGTEAVISAYNPGWKDPHLYDDLLTGYAAIIEGVKKAGIKRLLVVGGAGRLYLSSGIRLADSEEIPYTLLPGIRGLTEVYERYLLPEKKLDWVFLSPAASLEPGERTRKFRWGKDKLIIDRQGESRISVEDYAYAMFEILEKGTVHRKGLTVGY